MTELAADTKTGWALNAQLNCIKEDGGLCAMRLMPGARFECMFAPGRCQFLVGDKGQGRQDKQARLFGR